MALALVEIISTLPFVGQHIKHVLTSFIIYFLLDRGVASEIQHRTNHLNAVQESQIPTVNEAKEIYERMYSGRLTQESHFGEDPLEGNERLQTERSNEFYHQHNISNIYGEIVNERSRPFKQAISDFVNITSRLSLQV